MIISLCALKESTILHTVTVKTRGQGTWPTQRRKPNAKKKATHKKGK